jgi:hypothetical protein
MDMRSDKFIDLLLEVSADNQGFNAAGDIITQTADGFDLNSIWGEFQAAVAAINAARQTIVDLLTFPVTQNIERVPQISSAQFEKASEYGEPRGIRPSGAYFNLGYDFEWYDLAARFTWKFLADATASQVEAINSMALEADNQLVFTKVMDALYNKNNREADINGQIVPVYALYNADGTVPPAYKTNTFTGSETHYLTSGAATIESEDLDVLYSKLRMKGYSAENGVPHVLLVNPAEGAVIRTFRVATGATYDFIPAQGQPGAWVDANMTLVGANAPSSTYQGLNVIGRYGHILVVEDDLFPVGYVTLLGSGGRANLNNPVGIREHANAALRGLRLVKGPIADYPLIDSFYQRGFGTGIRQRGGAVVMQITASGTYTNPTILSGSA